MAQRSQRCGRRTAVKRQHPEMALHKACAQLLDIRQKQGGFFWTTIGHGGGGKVRGAQLKAMGMKPGVADILICKAGLMLWIELKSHTGALSEEQQVFRLKVLGLDHYYDVIRSVDELAYNLSLYGI